MDGLGDRLRRLRHEKGLSLEEVARRIGMSFAALGAYERGERKPSMDRLERLARFYDVSVDYLLGRSEYRWSVDRDRVRAIMALGAATGGPVHAIPILGVIHAGDRIPAEQEIVGWTAIPEEMGDPRHYFALRVRGDCMTAGPKPIHDGDVVIVRRQPTARDGEIAVVLWPDVAEAQLRRIYRKGEGVILRADNPAYPPEYVRGRDLEILGVVVGIQTTPAAARDVS